MFRRLESSLPKDFEFPDDLEGIGYFINEKDQIRMIKDPSQEFHFFISKNERVTEMQREAMNTCIRRNVTDRLLSSSLNITRLPLDTPADQPHVPILTSANIATAKRVIIYIGEAAQDLGIFAYRTVGQDSIASGSFIDFNNTVQACPDSPGLVIANPGQLVWYRRGKRAVTLPTWSALPRANAVAGPMRIDDVKNRIPQNGSIQEHVKCVFEEVVGKLVDKEARIDIIGLGDGAMEMIEYLQDEWDTYQNRVDAIAIGASHIWKTEFVDTRFREFWGKRARAYIVSPEDLDYPLTGRDDFGCNCYSAGEAYHLECVMPRAYKSMIRYFQMVADDPRYEAVEQYIPETNVESTEEEQEGETWE